MKSFLLKLKKIWLYFAQKLGKVNTVILLSLVYFIVIGITAIIAKLLNKDFLRKRIKSCQSSYWQPRESSEPTIERHKYQF